MNFGKPNNHLGFSRKILESSRSVAAQESSCYLETARHLVSRSQKKLKKSPHESPRILTKND